MAGFEVIIYGRFWVIAEVAELAYIRLSLQTDPTQSRRKRHLKAVLV
jgi:hypothetical protein